MSDKHIWRIQVPLLTNLYMAVDLLFIVFAFTGLAGGIIYLTSGVEILFSSLFALVIAMGGVIIVVFLAMGFVFLNMIELVYTIDENGVSVKIGDFSSDLNKYSWVLADLTQRIRFFGPPIPRYRKTGNLITWGQVEKAVFDERRRVLTLSDAKRVLVKVYCQTDVYPTITQFTENMLPDLEIKLI